MQANLIAQTSFGDLTGFGFDPASAASDGLLTALVIVAGRYWGPLKEEPWHPPFRRHTVEDDDNELLLILKAAWRALR